jgi:outer membrane protein TolC
MIKQWVLIISVISVSLISKTYGQKNISYFLEEAYSSSPLLKTNKIQQDVNDLNAKKSIISLTKPLIIAELNYMVAPVYSQDPGNSGFKLNPDKNNVYNYYGNDLSASNGGLYRGITSLEQPIFNKKRIDAVTAQTRIQNEILANNSSMAKHDLEKIVTDQYIICSQDIKQGEAAESIRDVIKRQITITQKLSEKGLAKIGDYKVLEIELKQQETAIEATRKSYITHLLELYSTCGIYDTTIYPISPLELQIKQEPVNSGFNKQFELDSVNLEASRTIFNNQYKPVFSLYSSSGLNAFYAPVLYKRFGWQAGIRFTQIIFDGHQKKINDQQINQLQKTTAINTAFFYKTNISRKQALKQFIRSVEEQLKSLQAQSEEYKKLLNYYQQQIIGGQSSIIEYVTLLRNSQALEQQRVSLLTQKALAISNYNYWNW